MNNVKRVIIKRDGRKQDFMSSRIYESIEKAIKSANVEISNEDMWKLVYEIVELVPEGEMKVEKVHEIVENVLKGFNELTYLSYRQYRISRDEERDRARLNKIDRDIINTYSDRASNGNVDENSFGGKEGVILEKEMEALSLNKMSYIFSKKHKDMEIYIHDLKEWAVGKSNCLVADIEELLKKGANVGQGDIRPTHRFSTAMQLVPVYIQIQSMSQFGGCATGHLDFILQPFLEELIADKYRDILEVVDEELVETKLTINQLKEMATEKQFKLTMKRVNKQIHESCQALITNLVTLQTRGTQTPFSSINFGGNTSQEGQMFNMALLEEMDRGIGRTNKTAIFPILCYHVKKDLNLYKGTPGFDVTIKAIEVQGRRHFPTFVNGDWSCIPKSDDYRNWHARMGCRTGMTEDVNCNTENERFRQVGRGNFAPHTICLPILAAKVKEQGGGLKEFYDLFLEDIELAKDGLLERYEVALANNITIAPTMYGSAYGIGIEEAKTPEDFLKHSSFAIGFTGLYECYEILTGKKFYETEEDLDEAVKIVETIHNKAKEYTKKYHLNFSCYAAPAESLVTKTMKALKDKYGYKNDRDYVTNSNHVPVWEEMSIFKKIDIESRFAKITTGGSIFHAEIDSLTTNVEASLKILQYAMSKDIPYFRFSHKTCTCENCSYTLEAPFEVCPECGCTDVSILATVTGYLTSELKRMNYGKRQEVMQRTALIKNNGTINE